MARRYTAYQGHLEPFASPPAWLWMVGGGLLWLFALVLAGSLVAPAPGEGSGLFAELGALLRSLAGGAAWVAAGVLVLAGGHLWRIRRGAPLVWMATGGLWLITGLVALMGLYPGGLPLLGSSPAGQAMAAGLSSLAGKSVAWLLALIASAGGTALVVWAAWDFIIDIPTMLHLPGLERLPGEEPVAEDNTPPPPPPEPEPEQEEAPPEPLVAPAVALEPAEPEPAIAPDSPPDPAGPVIKPRAQAPGEIKPRQENLAFSGGSYRLPPLELLQTPPERQTSEAQEESLRYNSRLLEKKLADFGVEGKVIEVAPGPVVTMYEFQPAPGVKISKVAGLADDLAMNLRATSIRIVAPIPHKAGIGIEIPNQKRETVYLRQCLASPAYQKAGGPLTMGLGKDILGMPVVDELARMPHLLIAGATGSGKSVFINTLVLSILYKASPDQVRLLMVDPKRIELSTYQDIPHLLYPLITEPQEATAGLRWAVNEMERRYKWLAQAGVRNIDSYNQRAAKQGPPVNDEGLTGPEHLPYVVIIIDELADLMMAASKEVEALITRLAQMARAAGLHLVLATQRPSVDVITGLIKANFPARISFKVTSRVDSRTILDQQGAEHLLGQGDMLFSQPGTSGIARLHGAYVSDQEIEAVVGFVKEQARPVYDESVVAAADENGPGGLNGEEVDERYQDAVALVRSSGQASISYVQRQLRVGYNRAARMIEQMEAEGIVGPSDGSRPREVLLRD